MRHNPLARLSLPDISREERQAFYPGQRYLWSRKAKDKLTRAFASWPIPVYIEMDPQRSTLYGSPWVKSVAAENDGLLLLVGPRKTFDGRSAGSGFGRGHPEEESLWTPFMILHRIADTMMRFTGVEARVGIIARQFFITERTPELYEFVEAKNDANELKSEASGHLRQLADEMWADMSPAMRASFDDYLPVLKDDLYEVVNSIGVDTWAGRNSWLTDDAFSDVFAKWVLFRKWAWQSEPPIHVYEKSLDAWYLAQGDESTFTPEMINLMFSYPSFWAYRRLTDEALRLLIPSLEALLKTTPMTIQI